MEVINFTKTISIRRRVFYIGEGKKGAIIPTGHRINGTELSRSENALTRQTSLNSGTIKEELRIFADAR